MRSRLHLIHNAMQEGMRFHLHFRGNVLDRRFCHGRIGGKGKTRGSKCLLSLVNAHLGMQWNVLRILLLCTDIVNASEVHCHALQIIARSFYFFH